MGAAGGKDVWQLAAAAVAWDRGSGPVGERGAGGGDRRGDHHRRRRRGLAAIVVMLAVGGFLASTLMKDRHGQSGLQRVFLRAGWWWTRSGGSHVYRSGPLGRAKWGSYQLPGVLAKTKLAEFADAWGQPFGVLEMPHRATTRSCSRSSPTAIRWSTRSSRTSGSHGSGSA